MKEIGGVYPQWFVGEMDGGACKRSPDALLDLGRYAGLRCCVPDVLLNLGRYIGLLCRVPDACLYGLLDILSSGEASP